jgi:hypothetical protein
MKRCRAILLIYRQGLLLAAITLVMVGCGPRAENNLQAARLTDTRGIHSKTQLSLDDIHGIGQHPFDDPNAKATVLVFTMQDCPIANSYVPTLNQFVDDFQSRGVRLFFVHVDPQLTNDAARKHAEEYQIKAPVVIDRQHAWVKLAAATRSPQAVVFSPAGEVLYSGRIDDKYVGFGNRRTHVTAHDLQDAIDAILSGRPIPKSTTEAIGCYIPSLPTGE